MGSGGRSAPTASVSTGCKPLAGTSCSSPPANSVIPAAWSPQSVPPSQPVPPADPRPIWGHIGVIGVVIAPICPHVGGGQWSRGGCSWRRVLVAGGLGGWRSVATDGAVSSGEGLHPIRRGDGGFYGMQPADVCTAVRRCPGWRSGVRGGGISRGCDTQLFHPPVLDVAALRPSGDAPRTAALPGGDHFQWLGGNRPHHRR